jgi:hypothetical protein
MRQIDGVRFARNSFCALTDSRAMTDPIRPSWSSAARADGSDPATPIGESRATRGKEATERVSAGVAQLVANATPSRAAVAATQSDVPVEAPDGDAHKSVEWYWDKTRAEAACVLPCPAALELSKWVMDDDGLAQQMLDHFTSGSAEPMYVNMNWEFERNAQLKELVASRIESVLASRVQQGLPIEEAVGSVWISQSDYGSSPAGLDQRRALGGTFFEFSVTGTAPDGGLQATIHVSDNYFWSPSDKGRATQCLHECGAQMVAEGKAVEFSQFGEGQLVVADPRKLAPMGLLITNGVGSEE